MTSAPWALPDTMFRVQYPWFGGPEVLRRVTVPLPVPAAGDVLVRVRAATTNPTDAGKRSGALRVRYLREPRPYGMGLDAAGDVVAIGPGVTGPKVGDRVFGMTRNGDGFADFTLLRAADAVVFDQRVDYADAACLAMSGSTAQRLRTIVAARHGSRVLVNGATGGIGLFLVQLLRLDGVEVTGTGSGAGLDTLRRLGIPKVVDYHDLPGGLTDRFDALVDFGGRLTARQGRSMLTRGGTFYVMVLNGSTMLASVTGRYADRRVLALFPRPSAESSRTILPLVESGALQVFRALERPLADAINVVTAVEASPPRAPGKVVLIAD